MKSIILFCALWCAVAYASQENPFVGASFYVNPAYIAEVQGTINANPSIAPLLAEAQNVSTAYWLDEMAKIGNISGILDGALAQQKKTGMVTLSTFVIYDVPDRDCDAAASNGEITCADSTCAAGIQEYQNNYIDPIVAVFKKYTSQPIVLIIEPDSLPNLATNLNNPKCQQAQIAYMTCIAYAIQQFSMQSNLYMYLDAAHGGWLGWTNNLQAAAQIFSQVLDKAGGPDTIRGFATNTANYQPLGSMSSTADPCNLKSQYNNAINEVIYANMLSQELATLGITNKGFIIDTSRNGQIDERSSCSNWCNIKGSGFGVRPVATPNDLGTDIIDALYWVKIPGESDGSSNSSAPRYDYHCGSVDSFIPAPQAGDWFPAFFIQLAQLAVPPLS